MKIDVLEEFVRLHVDEVVDVGVGLVSRLEILLLEGLVDFVTKCHLLSQRVVVRVLLQLLDCLCEVELMIFPTSLYLHFRRFQFLVNLLGQLCFLIIDFRKYFEQIFIPKWVLLILLAFFEALIEIT